MVRAGGPTGAIGKIIGLIHRFQGDRRANVTTVVALLLVPIIGMLALAGETSGWWMIQRSLQNAADSAAIAAATNADTTDVSGGVYGYQREARDVASRYGFTHGSNNVTVTAQNNQPCVSTAATNCYSVTISKTIPLYLTQIVGFTGDTAGSGRKLISATAIASPAGAGPNPPFCIAALGAAGVTKDLTVNGGPNSNLNGCDVASNGSATCNGNPIGGVGASYAGSGDTNDCAPSAINDLTLQAPLTDPYTSQAAHIPANTCPNPTAAASYPQEPNHGSLPATNLLSGTPAWSGTTKVLCGDQQLTGDVTLGSGTVMVIENGQLDLNGHTLTAASSTVIFTGPTIAGLSPSHFPTSSVNNAGTLNITAPTTGTWSIPGTSSGFALYQDPNLPSGSGVNITSAGNAPTYQITGLVYAPNSQVTISGSIGSANACIGFLVSTFKINGTANVIDSTNCDLISFSGEPGLGSGARVALVQ